jgi:uroporphyrinogen-III synthase
VTAADRPAASGPTGGAAGPLAGRRVLVARSAGEAPALSARVRELGGEPVEAPVLRIEEGDTGALRAAIHDLAAGAFTAVCLTSPNGVDAVADAIEDDGLDARVFAGVPTVACVGAGTAARLWERLRVRPDLVPEHATTESLGAAVPPGTGRVLLPRADIASEILHRMLADKGYEPVEVVAYRTVAADELPAAVVDDLAAGRIDLLPFASASTVHNFVALLAGRPWQGRVVSIGPVTSRACRELDVPVAVEAAPHDLDGLVAALVVAAGR